MACLWTSAGSPANRARRLVGQGEVYWVDFGEPLGSEPGFIRPAVVVQNDLFNDTRLATVMVCPITSNLRRTFRGHVALSRGEGGLRTNSIVETSQIMTVDKRALGEMLGQVSRTRVMQVLRGALLYLQPPP